MKFRIVQVRKDMFEIEFKRSFFNLWELQNTHGSEQSAKNCIDNLRAQYRRPKKMHRVLNY